MKTAEMINLQHTTTEIVKFTPHEHSEINHAFNMVLDSNLINFLIVIAVVIWLFKKFNVYSLIIKKRDEILEIIKNLEKERKEKKNYLEQTKEKVKNVYQEVIKMIDEGEHVSESISERIIKDAEQQASEMMGKAHSLVESERNMASNRVMREVTNAAFIIAEQHIKEAIDDRLHQKYINEFIDNMENIKG